jgi:hypothetical protein
MSYTPNSWAVGNPIKISKIQHLETQYSCVFDASAKTFAGAVAVNGVFTAVSTIELGHASDTTLSRVSAGIVAVEGVTLARMGAANTGTFAWGGGSAIGSSSNVALLNAAQTFTANQRVQVSGMNPIFIGQSGSASNYGAISFNNVATFSGMLGFFGRSGDNILYAYTPSGGSFQVGVNDTIALRVTGTDVSTPVLMGSIVASTSYTAISLSGSLANASSLAGFYGRASGSDAGSLYLAATSGQVIGLNIGGNITIASFASKLWLWGETSGAPNSYVQVLRDHSAQPMLSMQSTVATGGTWAVFLNSSGTPQGSIGATGTTATTFNTTSDARLKTDRGIVIDTDILRRTNIHDYLWNETGLPGRGVFAQEAVHVKPSAVTVGNDNGMPWMVDYSKYVPDLIVGWKSHDRRIAELEAEIALLRGGR